MSPGLITINPKCPTDASPAEAQARRFRLDTQILAALFFGVHKAESARGIAPLWQFLEPLEIADFDCAAAKCCGRLRTTRDAAGTPIGPLDSQIAAPALAVNVTLVRQDTRKFRRVPALFLSDRVAVL